MRVQFARSDSDLVLHMPAAALQELGIPEGTCVDLVIDDGRLIVTPTQTPPVYTFDGLLAGITPDNLHEDYFDLWSTRTED